MRFLQKIISAVGLALILLTLVFWLTRVLFIVSSEIKTVQDTNWHESPWAVSQTHFELERMRTALVKSYYSPSQQEIDRTIERIEIFWSRLDILVNGPYKAVLIRNQSLKTLTLEISEYLFEHEDEIYELTPDIHKQLMDRSKIWSSQWQTNSRNTYNELSQLHIDVGNRRVTTYQEIQILLLFISIFSITLLIGLIYLLIRNNRLLIKAKEVSDMKTDFLANMSHELRTPLNGIIGSINLFKPESDEQCELIDILDKSSEALLAQIDDILDYSQIESGQLTLEKTSFCLRDLIIDCISIFKIKSDNKNLYLDIATSQDLDIYIEGDKTKLRQVILNLISNAIKFTEHGGVIIDIAYIIHKQTYDIELKIIDTGIGITQENQKLLFNSFSQADSSIKRRFGGSGLGLSISKKLIEAMGGNLQLKSEINVGTQLGFNIPLTKGRIENTQSIIKDLTHYSSLSRKKLNFSGKHILVVEDNIVNQKIISKILLSFNIEVYIVQNGVEAIEHTLQNIDLIFMDIQMPLMDGVTASISLREKGITLPIVALTANATAEYKQKCQLAGMNEFLSKPFSLEKIEGILVKYFSS
ncbi:MAG: response regulator [Saccharospirillaceae bacterium]|nr:ATP-binding protein [Pseudomonadales bacterium]NRB79577.1 response regulator [Saccharospirillaceae bacterium]